MIANIEFYGAYFKYGCPSVEVRCQYHPHPPPFRGLVGNDQASD